jgi:Tol biopolymer transport system component
MTEAYWTPMFSRPEPGYGYGTTYGTRIENGRWTLPEVASFSKEYRAGEPFFAPDGRRLYFISRRPDVPEGEQGPERIWYMEREGGGWSTAQLLDTGANTMDIHWQFSLDEDGHLYFGGNAGNSLGGMDIYVSKYVDGAYMEPENLGPAVNGEDSDLCPFISPDGSYLVFSRYGREGDSIRISFRKDDGSWTQARELWPASSGIHGLCPTVSPDGKYLFYIGGWEGVEGICWVGAGRIDEVRKEVLGY